VQTMDTDNSGQVSVSELLVGYDEHPEFRTVLQAMDISKEDMGTVFSIMDKDKSGTVDYSEFAMQLHKMKTSDSHTLLVFIQAYVKELREKVGTQISLLQEALHERLEKSNADLLRRLDSQYQQSDRGSTRQTSRATLKKDKSEASLFDSPDDDRCAPSFLSEGLQLTNDAVLEQLRQAVAELGDAVRDASKKKSTELKSGILEAREPKSIAPVGSTPRSPVGPFSCAPWTSGVDSGVVQSSRANGARIPMPKCCQIRVSEEGVVSRCV